MRRISFIVLALSFLLAACTQQLASIRKGAFEPYQSSTVTVDQAASNQPQPQTALTQPRNVAMLLPLSGVHAQIGESLLNAAQLALFDMSDPSVNVIVLDTKGTTEGTAQAMQEAMRQNVSLVLGPLLGDNVTRAGNIARRNNLNVIGFTTDSSKTGQNIMTVGILPYDQGRRLADFAKLRNLNRVVAIVPQTPYAQEVVRAFEQNTANSPLTLVETIPLSQGADPTRIALSLAQRQGTVDAVLMPFGAPLLPVMARALTNNGLGPDNVAWLGAGLWDDPSVLKNPMMEGAFYAAPSPDMRRNFERQYNALYGHTPRRLASLGYDAMALAIVMLRQTNGQISTTELMDPAGFSGIDGIFRFQPNGLTERGLAIHKINGRNDTTIVDRAPQSFAGNTTVASQ